MHETESETNLAVWFKPQWVIDQDQFVFINLYIAASLTEYFKKYGTVVDAIVKMEVPVDAYGSGGSSGVPGKSRGFGFVKFADSSAVDEVSKV